MSACNSLVRREPYAKGGPQPFAITRGLHDNALLRLRSEGWSLKRIAALFGCCSDLIKRRLATLRQQQGTQAKTGRPHHAVTQGRHDDAILQMRTIGDSPTRIGMAFECSDTVIIKRLGILRRAGVGIDVR